VPLDCELSYGVLEHAGYKEKPLSWFDEQAMAGVVLLDRCRPISPRAFTLDPVEGV